MIDMLASAGVHTLTAALKWIFIEVRISLMEQLDYSPRFDINV